MKNKKRLIDANVLKGDFSFLRKMWSGTEICAVIDTAPTVDAVEVVHGHWIECEGTICAVCNKHFFTDGPWAVANYKANYCPNCGAKMDG